MFDKEMSFKFNSIDKTLVAIIIKTFKSLNVVMKSFYTYVDSHKVFV